MLLMLLFFTAVSFAAPAFATPPETSSTLPSIGYAQFRPQGMMGNPEGMQRRRMMQRRMMMHRQGMGDGRMTMRGQRMRGLGVGGGMMRPGGAHGHRMMGAPGRMTGQRGPSRLGGRGAMGGNPAAAACREEARRIHRPTRFGLVDPADPSYRRQMVMQTMRQCMMRRRFGS